VLLLAFTIAQAAERPDIICETPGELGSFDGLMFSPDSRHVLTLNNTSRVWRIADTNLVQTFVILSGRSGPDAGIFTLDGANVIATGEDEHTTRLGQWRVSDGSIVWRDGQRVGGSLAALPNTNFFALGTSGGIWVEKVDGNPDRRLFGNTNLPGYDIRTSRDGSVLVARETTAPFNNGIVRAWRISNETLIATWNLPSLVRSLDVSPDGKLVAVGMLDNNTRIYAVTNNGPFKTLPSGWTECVRFTPDGKLLFTVSLGKLMFWRLSDGALLKAYEDGLDGALQGQTADVSPDGKYFAYDRNGTLVVARIPLLITNATVRTRALNLEWQGGSGLYQLQQTTNLADGVWHSFGAPTRATSVTIETTNGAAFLRVQSLENPP
jgi:WD40 repeat protein